MFANVPFIAVNPQKRAWHQDGVSGRQFKLSSVQKLMVVAAAPDTEESWENIETLLSELDIASLSACPFAVDMKVQLILLGKQTGASKHNCPYGHGSAPYNTCPLITLKSLEENYQAFQAAGSDEKKAKDFNNCVRPALLQGDPQTTTLELLTIAELHIMTGTVGKLIQEIIKSFPIKEDGNIFINTFMKTNNISWCSYQPGTFEGNQARKLLRSSKNLLSETEGLPSTMIGEKTADMVRTLVKFDQVVVACFGQDLDPCFRASIKEFENLYRSLGISVTPKVHCVFQHVTEFLEMTGLKTGLGAWSEQAMESVHHDLRLEWERSKVGPNHPNYAEQLFSTIVRYNSKHI